MTADSSNSRGRRFLKFVKYDRNCVVSLLKHSCWSAIILGGIMLGLGIVLRSSVFTDPSSTVTSSGLLFILIGIFIICLGPFAAIYDLIAKRKRHNRNEVESGTGPSPRPSRASDPPSYNQVMTAMKTPSATHNMRFSELSANELTSTQPPPPSYEEVAEVDNNYLSPSSAGLQDTRRMTAP